MNESHSALPEVQIELLENYVHIAINLGIVLANSFLNLEYTSQDAIAMHNVFASCESTAEQKLNILLELYPDLPKKFSTLDYNMSNGEKIMLKMAILKKSGNR